MVLISFSELYWHKGNFKNFFNSNHVTHNNTNKTCSNTQLTCKLNQQHIINLSKQFYKHKLDDITLQRMKELGLKRRFRGCRGGRKKARTWYSNKGIYPHVLWPLPKCKRTKWNHTLVRMLLINIQCIKSKLDALLHHITLNDINICFITENWINIDFDLQLIEAKTTGLQYKIINKHRENQPGGGIVCIYKRHLDTETCTEGDTYTSFES